MARFDVYRMPGGEYALDCQADLLAHLTTRFCVPLQSPSAAPEPARFLNPAFEIDGKPVIMITQFAAALPLRELRHKVASLSAHDFEITRALDYLTTGF
jgi:toxin CcdB